MDAEFLESPFMPGHPVSPDKFKGRNDDVKKVLRYMPTVKNGKQRHFFVTGDRGMGKTSFVKYISNRVENQFQLTSIYINNDGNDSLDLLVAKIMEATLEKYNTKGVGSKIKDIFLKYVKSINFKGSGVTFKDNNPDLVNSIRDGFSNFLKELSVKLNKEETGILFIIDDINGLSRDKNFTSWYKNFSDTINFYDEFIPIAFCLVGYPDEFDALSLQNPSFSRIFERIIIGHIDNEDIRDFFVDAYSKLGIAFANDNSLNLMVNFAFGMPLAMQQIGESVFWLVENKIIDKNIAIDGIINATGEFGNKQMKSILNQIRSPYYENILIKLGGNKYQFKKSELKDILTDDEWNKVSDFLTRAKQLGIIEPIGRKNSGEYQFTNRLYFVYFMIQHFKQHKHDINQFDYADKF